MSIHRFTVVCSALVGLLLVVAAVSPFSPTMVKEHTSRYDIGKKCVQSGSRTEGMLCNVSFADLQVNPEAYEGKYIRISGFALDVEGHSYLYQSEDSFRYSAGTNGLDLMIPEEQREKYSRLVGDGTHAIEVVGKFNASGGRDPLFEAIGAVSGPFLSISRASYPWAIPVEGINPNNIDTGPGQE